MNPVLTRRLMRTILLISIATSAILLIILFYVLGPVVAIKASYTLIGVGVAMLLYVVSDVKQSWTETKHPVSSSPQMRWYQKGVWITVATSIAVTRLTNERSVVLLLGLPIASALLVVQLRGIPSAKSMLPQIAAVFSVSPLTKYMTTGVYFGSGDILRHIQYTEGLIQSGSVSAISSPVYQFFPGLHILTGSLSITTNMPIYDSLLLLGIITYAFSIPLVFLIAQVATFDTNLSLSISYAVSLLALVSYYATYFFPQAFAVVIGLFLLFVAFRSAMVRTTAEVPLTIISVVLSTVFVLIHHFTFVLLAPIIVFLVAPSVLGYSNYGSGDRDIIVTPRTLPLAIAGITAVSYWVVQKTFIGQFFFATSKLFLNRVLAIGGDGQAVLTTYTIGTTISRQSTREAVRSLLSPDGIYAILLVSIFVFGAIMSITYWNKYRRLAPFIAVGTVGSLLVFKTPILISRRFGLPVSFFFAFVVGIGIHHLLRVKPSKRTGTALSMVVLVLLSTTAPISVADDLYGLYSGPDFVGLRSGPDTQKEFTEQEYLGLRETSEFIKNHDMQAATFWITRVGLSRFGATPSDQVEVTRHSIRTPERFFVYRKRWPQHQVYIDGAGSKLYISREKLTSLITVENKIYTTGRVGVIENIGGNVLGPEIKNLTRNQTLEEPISIQLSQPQQHTFSHEAV